VPPCLPLPTQYLAEYKYWNNQISDRIYANTILPSISKVFEDSIAIRAVNAIRELLLIIRSESRRRDISKDTSFASNYVLPVLHELLSMLNYKLSITQEGFRLAAMLLIRELQATLWGRALPTMFHDKLRRWLCSKNLDWSSSDPMLLWIVVVGLTSNMNTTTHSLWFRRKLETLMIIDGLSLSGVMHQVSQIVWDLDVLRVKMERLKCCFREATTKLGGDR
jgi:hypothetical protein